MNIRQIKSLVKQKESANVEFKTSTAQLKPAFETICAFLNGQGGTVLIGVNNKGDLIGQDVTDNTLQEISREISRLEPPSHLNVACVPVRGNKCIIAIQTNGNEYAPYIYDGRSFQRDQSVTRKMPQQRYEQLLAKRNQVNHSWESFAINFTPKMLDQNTLIEFLHDAVATKRLPKTSADESVTQILEKLKLVKQGKLLNAAIVLFGKNFLPDYPQCQLKLARFKGINRREFLDNDIIYGNAFQLLEKGMAFVKKHLPVAARIVPGKLKRVETPLVPFQAIREALVNAICHRDYSNRRGSISLAVYDDRMEISNSGGLPQGISLEMIKNGHSDPRNPLIAEVFYKAGYIEKWGRGIQEIISHCLQAGDPEPEFTIVDDVSFSVVLRFPHTLRNVAFVEYSKEELASSTGWDENLLEPLTQRQRQILAILLSTKESTMKQISGQLTNPPTDRMIRHDLLQLKQLGFADCRGKTRNTLWFALKKTG